MINPATNPSTPDGIRRRAKKLKRSLGITHMEALELASKDANFQNFLHAKRSLGATRDHAVFLTAYWQEAPGIQRLSGRSTIEVRLTKPLSALLTRQQVGRCRNLAGFKIESEDHLEMVLNGDSEARAVDLLFRAERALRFVDTTGLVPAPRSKAYKAALTTETLPGRDHESFWVDPSTEALVILDEPYPGRDYLREKRSDWMKEFNFHSAEPEWAGLYLPGQTRSVIISNDAGVVSRVNDQLESLSRQSFQMIAPTPEDYYSAFYSPARLKSGKARKPRPGPSFSPRMGAAPYGFRAGLASQWRPEKPLPLSQHKKIAKVLCTLAVTDWKRGGLSYQADLKINSARSLLEDWSLMEHRGEVSRKDEEKLYYGYSDVDGYKSASASKRGIDRVISMLTEGYADCKPRRDLVASLQSVANRILIKQSKS
jgi:hypothetical protein